MLPAARDAPILSVVLAIFRVLVSAPANFQDFQPLPILYLFIYIIEK